MVLSYLLTFLLFALPFVIFPFGISPFESPKIIIAQIGIGVLVGVYLIKHRFDLAIFDRKLLAALSISFLFGVAHLFLFNSQTTFFGNKFRLQGVFMLWNLLSLALVSSQIKIKISQVLILGLLALQILATFLVLPNINERAVGTLGEPNSLAAFAVFIWPFVFFGSKRLPQIMAFFGALILIILSGSRSGFIAFLIQLIFLFLAHKIRMSLKKNLIITTLLIALTLTFPFIEGGGWYENRAEIWQTAYFTGWLNPLLGAGFGNIDSSLKQSSILLGNNVQYQFIDSAHNFLLDFWVQGGFVTLGSILFLLYMSLKNYLKRESIREMAVFLGIITVMLFNPVSIVILIYFWWLVGASFLKDNTI